MNSDSVSKFLLSIAPLAWPILIGGLVFFLWNYLTRLVSAVTSRIEESTDIQMGFVKIKGPVISFDNLPAKGGDDSFEIENATEAERDERDAIYAARRNLLLVHTIRPAKTKKKIEGYRVFDSSIYLHSHSRKGRLNDVLRVTYYFGKYWGEGNSGSKFIVESGNEQFAITVQSYNSFLCRASVEFHDGQIVLMDRYIDVEMAPLYGVPLKQARK